MTRLSFPNIPFDRARATSGWRDFQATKLYDGLAAAPLILVFGSSGAHVAAEIWAGVRLADASSLDLHAGLSLLRQTVVLALVILMMTFLILRGPAKAKARGLLPRIAAFAGTYLGVALVWLPTQPIGLGLSFASLVLMLAGVAFSVYSLSHLGGSFSLMAEARRLVTDGPYSRIRHPLYLGEGVSLLRCYAAIFVAVGAGDLRRAGRLSALAHEERGMRAGRALSRYESYRMRTAQLVPGLY